MRPKSWLEIFPAILRRVFLFEWVLVVRIASKVRFLGEAFSLPDERIFTDLLLHRFEPGFVDEFLDTIKYA